MVILSYVYVSIDLYLSTLTAFWSLKALRMNDDEVKYIKLSVINDLTYLSCLCKRYCWYFIHCQIFFLEAYYTFLFKISFLSAFARQCFTPSHNDCDIRALSCLYTVTQTEWVLILFFVAIVFRWWWEGSRSSFVRTL